MRCYNLDTLIEGGLFMGTLFILARIITVAFVYIYAKKRGYGSTISLLCAVISGIIPIVVLPLYFLFGRNDNKVARNQDSDIIDIEATVVEEVIQCPSCGSEIQESATVCPHCNHRLQAACESCGELIRTEYERCPYCQATFISKQKK